MFDSRRLLLFLVIGILAGYTWWRYDHRIIGGNGESFTTVDSPKLDLNDVKVLSALDAEYSKLVESVVPSVVSITSSRTFTQLAPLTIQDLLAGRQRTQQATSTSLGSGVIVSKEGHIVTNHHVAAGMNEVWVQLTDGRRVPAKFVGSDPVTDIAVLKIDAPGVQPLSLGDSDGLRVGQQIFAVGNPYGLEASVSRGIVSAKGRQAASDASIEYVQHDAAVNQGNSGGPLLNLRGEVVGINSAIFTRTGGWQGISFAMPSNSVRRVLDMIVKHGRVIRGYLGVGLQDLNPELARNLHVPDQSGAVITGVVVGSPADRAGLVAGDVVRSFDGKPVKSFQQFRQYITGSQAGQEAEVGYLRNGKLLSTKVKITEMPSQTPGSVPVP